MEVFGKNIKLFLLSSFIIFPPFDAIIINNKYV